MAQQHVTSEEPLDDALAVVVRTVRTLQAAGQDPRGIRARIASTMQQLAPAEQAAVERLLEPAEQSTLDDFLAELDEQARKDSQQLEDGAILPHGFTAFYYPLTPREERELERFKAAGLLATDAATYIDIVRGRPVPRHRLNDAYLDLLDRWPGAA